jgi:hypothetical protein
LSRPPTHLACDKYGCFLKRLYTWEGKNKLVAFGYFGSKCRQIITLEEAEKMKKGILSPEEEQLFVRLRQALNPKDPTNPILAPNK